MAHELHLQARVFIGDVPGYRPLSLNALVLMAVGTRSGYWVADKALMLCESPGQKNSTTPLTANCRFLCPARCGYPSVPMRGSRRPVIAVD